jgi:hypothetical protein
VDAAVFEALLAAVVQLAVALTVFVLPSIVAHRKNFGTVGKFAVYKEILPLLPEGSAASPQSYVLAFSFS